MSKIKSEGIGKIIFERLNNVLQTNPGYEEFKLISDIIDGKIPVKSYKNLTSDEINLFKFAPSTSCEVERSFSEFKKFFSDRLTNFTEENLNLIFTTHYNINKLNNFD